MRLLLLTAAFAACAFARNTHHDHHHLARKRHVDRIDNIAEADEREARLREEDDRQRQWHMEERRRHEERLRQHELERARYYEQQAAIMAQRSSQRRRGCAGRWPQVREYNRPPDEIVSPPVRRRCPPRRGGVLVSPEELERQQQQIVVVEPDPRAYYPPAPPQQQQQSVDVGHSQYHLFGDGSSGHVPQPQPRQAEQWPEPYWQQPAPQQPVVEQQWPNRLHLSPPEQRESSGDCGLFSLNAISEHDIVRHVLQQRCHRDDILRAIEDQRRRAYQQHSFPRQQFPYLHFSRTRGWVNIASEADRHRFDIEEAEEEYRRLMAFYEANYPRAPLRNKEELPVVVIGEGAVPVVEEEKKDGGKTDVVIEQDNMQAIVHSSGEIIKDDKEEEEETPAEEEGEKKEENEIAKEEEGGDALTDSDLEKEDKREEVVEEAKEEEAPKATEQPEIFVPEGEDDEGEEVKIPRNSGEKEEKDPLEEELQKEAEVRREEREKGFRLPSDDTEESS